MYWDRILIKKLISEDNNIDNNILINNFCKKLSIFNICNKKKIIFNICNKKKVKFNNIIKVILIPCRNDYLKESLNDLLWWKEEDYCKFKKNFLLELNIVIII
jgi:hypothetical protein